MPRKWLVFAPLTSVVELLSVVRLNLIEEEDLEEREADGDTKCSTLRT